MITWTITKQLHGVLEGIVVTDTMTADASLPAPFAIGRRVRGIGSDFTVLEVTKA